MSHGANAARDLVQVLDSAQHRRRHIAMLQRRRHAPALIGIISQPVQQLRESPLGRICAPAPPDRFQPAAPRRLRDERRFFPRPVIAPQVIIVQRLQSLAHRNHARPGGVNRDRLYRIAPRARRRKRFAHRLHQRAHMLRMALRRMIRVIVAPLQRILGHPRAKASALAIDNRHAHAQRPKIHPRDNRHSILPPNYVDGKPTYTRCPK